MNSPPAGLKDPRWQSRRARNHNLPHWLLVDVLSRPDDTESLNLLFCSPCSCDCMRSRTLAISFALIAGHICRGHAERSIYDDDQYPARAQHLITGSMLGDEQQIHAQCCRPHGPDGCPVLRQSAAKHRELFQDRVHLSSVRNIATRATL
jgi:hypothetical protein